MYCNTLESFPIHLSFSNCRSPILLKLLIIRKHVQNSMSRHLKKLLQTQSALLNQDAHATQTTKTCTQTSTWDLGWSPDLTTFSYTSCFNPTLVQVKVNAHPNMALQLPLLNSHLQTWQDITVFKSQLLTSNLWRISNWLLLYSSIGGAICNIPICTGLTYTRSHKSQTSWHQDNVMINYINDWAILGVREAERLDIDPILESFFNWDHQAQCCYFTHQAKWAVISRLMSLCCANVRATQWPFTKQFPLSTVYI